MPMSTFPEYGALKSEGQLPSSKRRFSETLQVKTSPLAVLRELHQGYFLAKRLCQHFLSTVP